MITLTLSLSLSRRRFKGQGHPTRPPHLLKAHMSSVQLCNMRPAGTVRFRCGDTTKTRPAVKEIQHVNTGSASSHSTVPKGCMQPKRGTFLLLRRAVECSAVTRAVEDIWRTHHQRWRIACFGHCLRSPGGREGQTQKSCKLEPTIRSAHSQNPMLSLTSKFC